MGVLRVRLTGNKWLDGWRDKHIVHPSGGYDSNADSQ